MSFHKHTLTVLAFSVLSALSANAVAAETETQLDSIQVSASLSNSKKAVDAEKISVRQAGLLRDVLRDVPGVNVGGTNGFNQTIFMRGAQESGVNIQVDGARQLGDTFHHNGNLLLDPDLIKRVDVSVGGNSVSDGAGSLGGAIKFKTVDASDLLTRGKNFGAKVKTGYNSNTKGWSNSLYVYGRLDNQLDLLAYYNHKDYDIGETGGSNKQPVGGDGKDDNYLFKASWRINDSHKFTASAEQVKFAGLYPYKAEFVVLPTAAAKYADYIPQEYIRRTQRLAYEYNPETDWVDLSLNLYHTANDLDRTKPHPNLPDHLMSRGKDNGRLNGWGWGTGGETWGFSADNVSLFDTGSLNHTLRTGYEWYKTTNYAKNVKYSDRTVEYFPGEKGVLNSIYVEDAIQWGGFTATPGVRYDNYKATYMGGRKQTMSEFSKALGLRYDFASGFSVFGNYTELFRAPDTVESIRLRGSGYEQREDLQPETGDNKEIGVSFNRNGLFTHHDSLSIVAKYFQTDYENMIVQAAVPGVAKLNNRQNAGKAKVTGAEISARYRINNLYAGIGFSSSRSKLSSTKHLTSKGSQLYGDALGRDAGNKYTLSLGYDIKAIDTSLNWNSIFFSKYDKNGVHKPGYGVNDFSVSYKPSKGKLKGMEATLGVYNIFDKKYVSHTARCEIGRATCADIEPGRTIKLGLSYRFN